MAYNYPVTAVPEQIQQPTPASRWETLLWPRWLPVRARTPLIAQITGAVAVTALIVGPWWASAPESIDQPAAISAAPADPVASPVAVATVPSVAQPKPAPVPDARPSHLNLDVRHSFKSVEFSVSVDGKTVFNTRLDGSGKRFGVFGKRSERGYTKTLDLAPGAHIVRVRVLSPSDKFDQTRVERFDLGSASVATMRISADKSGLSLVSERPPAPPPPVEAPAAVAVAPAVPAPVAVAPPVQAAPVAAPQAMAPQTQDANNVINLLQSVRSMLIGIAGFVASTATAFMVQEWLRSRKGLIFANAEEASQFVAGERRRRRRPGRARTPREGDAQPADPESAP